MTFSIIGRSPRGDQFGIAISSSSPAVAARCSHARAGVGVVASQNITDPRLGGRILTRLAQGDSADRALEETVAATPERDFRQVMALGVSGPAAVHSGSRSLGIFNTALGRDCAAAGNLLAHPGIPSAMVRAFDTGPDMLAERLLAALRAGRDAGGEAGAVHSAGLLIVRDVEWPIVDLRVDFLEHDPIAELDKIYRLYAPQIDDYVRRALDPGHAPHFGVPGDR
jgi:uncharacterized Ntn-hydrolase superfamily protein